MFFATNGYQRLPTALRGGFVKSEKGNSSNSNSNSKSNSKSDILFSIIIIMTVGDR